MKRAAVLSVLCAILSGCASVYVCDKGGHTLVTANNTCWYLFNCIPVASGDPDRPNKNTTRFFHETVSLASNMKILEKAMRLHDATSLENLNSYTTDESILFFFLTRHACYTSAELIISPKQETP